jgi:hypothetical protein
MNCPASKTCGSAFGRTKVYLLQNSVAYRQSLRLHQRHNTFEYWCLERRVRSLCRIARQFCYVASPCAALYWQITEHSKGAGGLKSHNTLLTARCAPSCDPCYYGQIPVRLRVVRPGYAAFPSLAMALRMSDSVR